MRKKARILRDPHETLWRFPSVSSPVATISGETVMKMLQTLSAALFAGLLTGCAGPAAAVGGLADLSIYDRSEGRTLPVYWHGGRAYVAGRPGNEYQLNLRSRQGEEVLAVLSVDGVNVITGQTASVQQSGYVLAPGRALELRGWRKDLSRTAAFYFTSLGDSYAARTGRPDNVGAIGVALFRKKHQEPAPAISAPFSRQEKSSADAEGAAASRSAEAPLGTGHGRSETSQARYVGFERASSEPAETIVIYYDSYANLLARGIVPRQATPRPAPHPFPGFVTDPPA
jgi:hypothetical protein